MTNTIEEKARKIVVEQLGCDLEKVTPTANFVEDLDADSLDTVELTMAFEEEFGIEVTDEEREKAETFGQAVDLITEKLGSVG